MKRRNFLRSAGLVAGAAGMGVNAFAKAKKDRKDWYELRVYSFATDAQLQRTSAFFEKAAVPAYNRIGCSPVGLFTELKPQGISRLFVLITYPSLDIFSRSGELLEKDGVFQEAGSDYLKAAVASPAYARIESSFMHAFDVVPHIEIPPKTGRMFELRRYESPGEYAGMLKISMFNEKGEVPIFRRTGLKPVFFGETLIGPLRPNLTYMIRFDDMADHDASWQRFKDDPEWKQISALPQFAKVVSNINSTFLTPLEGSQV